MSFVSIDLGKALLPPGDYLIGCPRTLFSRGDFAEFFPLLRNRSKGGEQTTIGVLSSGLSFAAIRLSDSPCYFVDEDGDTRPLPSGIVVTVPCDNLPNTRQGQKIHSFPYGLCVGFNEGVPRIGRLRIAPRSDCSVMLEAA